MPQVKPIPDGYHSVQPYLMLKNCAEAITFYAKAFGAKEKFRMPDAEGRVSHAEIEIGDSIIMMSDEAPQMDAFSVEHFGGSPISLLIYTPNCDAMHAQALAAERKVFASRPTDHTGIACPASRIRSVISGGLPRTSKMFRIKRWGRSSECVRASKAKTPGENACSTTAQSGARTPRGLKTRPPCQPSSLCSTGSL